MVLINETWDCQSILGKQPADVYLVKVTGFSDIGRPHNRLVIAAVCDLSLPEIPVRTGTAYCVAAG